MKHKALSLIVLCLLAGMETQAQIVYKRANSSTRSTWAFPNMYFSQDGDKDAWSYSTQEGAAYSDRNDISTIDYIATKAYLDSHQTLEDWTAPTYEDYYVKSIQGWEDHANWNLANVHDPSVCLADDGYYYMVQTDASYGNAHEQSGGHFICRRSKNLVDWEVMGPTMKGLPSWVKPKLNEIRAAMGLGESTVDWENGDFGYWAPCIRKVREGLYRMYYCITIPGTIDGDGTWGERAFIGLMETSDPSDCDSWEDKGYVVTNYSDRDAQDFRYSTTDYQNCYYKYNAIDPTYIITPEGEHWLVYGSWHSGFAAVQLNPETGKTLLEQGNPWGAENEAAYGKRIFTRSANNRWQGSEAPEVVYHDGYYYLFMAFDALDVPYNTHVVRSETIDGVYEDITGTKFTNGTTQGNVYPVMTHPYKFGDDHGWVGISHCAVFDDGKGNWYYASQQRFPADYDGNPYSNAVMLGGVRRVIWTESGWPLVMPERYANVPQELISEEELVGGWQNIDLSYQYGVQKPSENMTLNADHTVSGGAFDGQAWSFDPVKGILRVGQAATLYLSRECDWEANPRKATIVYAGLSANNRVTYWGKKVD